MSVTSDDEFKFEFRPIKTLKLPTGGGASFGLIGATRSGKSTAMAYIYEKFFCKHITIMYTYSAHTQVYEGLANAAICDKFHKEMIEEPLLLNRKTKNKYKFLIVFDDFALTGKQSEVMTRLLTTGRNSGMSVILTGQKLEMLNSTGRANINYVFCFRQNTDLAIETTIKTYLNSYFPRHLPMDEKVRMYREITQDHSFFVVDTLEGECYVSRIPLEDAR